MRIIGLDGKRKKGMNAEKITGLISKTTLHVQHAFWYISLPSLYRCNLKVLDVKWANNNFFEFFEFTVRSRNGPEARFRSVKIRANLQPRVCLTDACGNFRSTYKTSLRLRL